MKYQDLDSGISQASKMLKNFIKKYGVIIILIVLGFLVYANALSNKFVLDDEDQIVNNPLWHKLSNIPQIFTADSFNSGGSAINLGNFYRPILSLTFLINYRLWGLKTPGYHVFQVIFHVFTAILIFYLLREILDRFRFRWARGAAFLASLLFVVHPANVEAVGYISAVEEVLYSFFILLSFLVFLKAYDKQNQRNQNKYLFLVFTLMFLGLLAKESAIVIFPLIAIYLFLFESPSRKILKKLVAGTIITGSFYAFLRFAVAHIPIHGGTFGTPIEKAGFLSKLLTIPAEIMTAIKTIVFPLRLLLNQQFVINSPRDFRFWGYSLILLAIICLVGILIKYSDKQNIKIPLFFIGWFVIGIAPTINLPLDYTFAERWLYFPWIGLAALFAVLFFQIIERVGKNWRPSIYILLIVIIASFSVRTILRNRDWRDGLTLFGHDLQYAPDDSYSQNNYGWMLAKAGRFDEAQLHFEKAIELDNSNPSAHSNLGAIYEIRGDLERAAGEYQKAVELGVDYRGSQMLANVLFKLRTKSPDRRKEAETLMLNAINNFPRDTLFAKLLAIMYNEDGNLNGAYNLVNLVLRLEPDNSAFQQFRANLLQGKRTIFKD